MADSREEGADTKALHDYATLIIIDIIFRIRRPLMLANNFKIKPIIIQMIQANQFSGSQAEDPNVHIGSFLEIWIHSSIMTLLIMS